MVELILIMALIVTVMSLLVASDVPQRIVGALHRSVECVISAGACKIEPASEEKLATNVRPLPCTSASSEETRAFTTDFLLWRGSSGTRYSVRERSDGVVEILDTSFKGKGHVVSGGAKFGKRGGKVGIGGTVAAEKIEESGDLFVLETPEERARFDRARAQPAVDAYVDSLAELKDPSLAERKQVYLMSQFRDGSYERLSHGASVDLMGSAFRIIQGTAGIEGETGTVVQENDKTGERTVTFDVKGSSLGELGTIFGGASASSEGLVGVSLTTGPDGEPTHLVLSTETEVDAGANLTIDPTTVVDLPSFIRAAAGLNASKKGGLVVRLTAGIPLDDPRSREAALAFANNPGFDSASGLFGFFDNSGHGLVEVLKSSTSTDGFGAGVGLLASLGFEDEHSVRALTIKDAWGWEPRSGLSRRTDCAP